MIMSASATPSPPKPVEVEMALPSDDAVAVGRKAEAEDTDDVPEAAAAATRRRGRGRLMPVFMFGAAGLIIATSVAVGVNSSRNKRAASSFDANTSGTMFEKSFTMANTVKAGPRPSSTSRDASLLCGCEECEDVKNEVACGVVTDNCHTCEARINWLQTISGGSLTEDDACKLVGKYEFKQVCGPCYKCKTQKSASSEDSTTENFWCNNPSCTDTLFDAAGSACDGDGCHSCKSRVKYLENFLNFNEKEACNKVTKEFPTECPCQWNTRKSK